MFFFFKTSLVKRYCNNDFTRQYFPTVGVDFFLKRLTLQKSRNVTLKIWDVGGSSQNSNLLDKYIFGSNVCFILNTKKQKKLLKVIK